LPHVGRRHGRSEGKARESCDLAGDIYFSYIFLAI
jgi:hypothetical protein